MFVLVPSTSSATVESIKTMSLSTNKIYFMAKYSQIVAKGTVYGVDPSTGKELESLVSVLGGTKGDDGTVTVDFSSLNYYTSEGTKTIIGAIGAIDAKVKAEMDKLAASKTLNDSYEFTGQIRYVAASDDTASHIALVDEAGTELSTIAVSDIIGNGVLKTSAYNSTTGVLTLTFAQADGNEKSFEVDLKAMLDINDIAIDSESSNYLGVKLGTADSNGEQQALFSAKVVKVAEASDTKTGLVDAKDVKDYVDGKTTDLEITAEGDAYVYAYASPDNNKHINVNANVQDVSYTTGTHATYNSEGIKIADGTGATISGVAKSLVDGEQATNAIKTYVDFVVAEEALRSDAKVLSSIKALDKESSTVDGNNIHINYKEEDGIVTIESVTEDYANVNYHQTSSTPDYPKSDADIFISVNDQHKLINSSAINNLKYYIDDKSLEEQHRVDKKIDDISYSFNKPSSTVDGTNIHINYKEEDGIVTIESVTEDYATINRTSDSFSIGSDDLHKLVRGSDLSDAVSYVYNRAEHVANEIGTNCRNYTDTIIDNNISRFKYELNVHGDTSDSSNYISFTYSQENGKIQFSNIATKYAYFNSDKTFNNGIITGQFLKEAFEDMWDTYEG